MPEKGTGRALLLKAHIVHGSPDLDFLKSKDFCSNLSSIILATDIRHCCLNIKICDGILKDCRQMFCPIKHNNGLNHLILKIKPLLS